MVMCLLTEISFILYGKEARTPRITSSDKNCVFTESGESRFMTLLLLLHLQFSVSIIAPGETVQFAHSLSDQAPGIIPLRGSVVWPSEMPPHFQWVANGPKGGGVLDGKETLHPSLVVSKPG